MKYKGITIHKNKTCNTWYTRFRENGKQFYLSGRTQKDVLIKLKQSLNNTQKIECTKYTLLDWYNKWLEL